GPRSRAPPTPRRPVLPPAAARPLHPRRPRLRQPRAAPPGRPVPDERLLRPRLRARRQADRPAARPDRGPAQRPARAGAAGGRPAAAGGRRDGPPLPAGHVQPRGPRGLRPHGPRAARAVAAPGQGVPRRSHRGLDRRRPPGCLDPLRPAPRTPAEEDMSVPPRLLPLLVVGWLCAAACATPPPQPRQVDKQRAASAWLVTPGEKFTLPLADEAAVTLRVEAPAPLEVEVLEKPKATPQWSLKADGPPALREKDKGEAVWEQKYQLEPHKEGEHLVELPPLRYRSGDGEWQKVSWQPVKSRAPREPKPAEPGAARDITSIEELPPAEPARGWLLWAGLGLGAVLLGVTALVVGRRRVAKPPALPPHEWALRELARLAERRPESGA